MLLSPKTSVQLTGSQKTVIVEFVYIVKLQVANQIRFCPWLNFKKL